MIYEVEIFPQEPALQSPTPGHVGIPYLYNPPRAVLRPGETFAFKNIITNCPTEIFLELREGEKPKKTFGRWSGKLAASAASLDF